jgi:tetratricopeptide (TPR) repeat protein
LLPRYRLAAATLLAVSLYAQDSSTTLLNGRLNAGGAPANDFLIELTSMATRTATRLDVSLTGDFRARSLPYGEYVARVTTLHGETVTQQFLSINQPVSMLELRLPARPAMPTGSTVSVRELRNPPGRQAVALSAAAQRFAGSGQFDRAASELEKAIRISPDFAMAHSNLAVQYLRLGKFREAETELGRAIELAGPNVQDLSNLAFAQLAQERFGEARATARDALKLRKDHPQAHYVLGLSLVIEPDTRGEGVAHLDEAAKTLESARRAIAALAR